MSGATCVPNFSLSWCFGCRQQRHGPGRRRCLMSGRRARSLPSPCQQKQERLRRRNRGRKRAQMRFETKLDVQVCFSNQMLRSACQRAFSRLKPCRAGSTSRADTVGCLEALHVAVSFRAAGVGCLVLSCFPMTRPGKFVTRERLLLQSR